MHSDHHASPLLKLLAWCGLGLLHLPLLVIALYAFNTESAAFSFPLQGFTLQWFAAAARRPDILDAVWLSLQVAAAATLLALLLGTLAALAMWRHRFFGKEAFSMLLVLPIALPGIITGLALLASFQRLGIEPGMLTLIVSHATFCVVIVFNNVLARFRRTSLSLIEASLDLGANGWQTFRYVVLPNLATAMLAGGLLAFALSFDEIIVTTFTAGHEKTLPIWLLGQLTRPREDTADLAAGPTDPATRCADHQCGGAGGDAGHRAADSGRLLSNQGHRHGRRQWQVAARPDLLLMERLTCTTYF